jgi:hypothetical protein
VGWKIYIIARCDITRGIRIDSLAVLAKKGVQYMKRTFSCIVLAFFLLFSAKAFADASVTDSITITVDGRSLTLDQPPVVENGLLLVPLRDIYEALGAELDWDQATGTITATSGADVVIMQIGNHIMTKNGSDATLNVPPRIVNSRTLVPLRAVTGVFDVKVVWDGEHRNAAIINNDETSDRFSFGMQAHVFHPETVDQFVPVFAVQLARYNQIAHSLWPNNTLVDQSVVLEDVDTSRFWYIAPDGATKVLSEEEIEDMGISRRYSSDDFSFFEGGMYITISEQSVRDKLGADKLHVGAYDSILWLTHEGFHKFQSDEWISPESEDIPNRERDEFFANIDARAKRNLLQRQIMRAVANPGDTALILDALATYEDYKIQNPDDYLLTWYFDKIEGTAKYFEVVSSLYIFYPDQVNSKEDLERAFTYLARYEDNYLSLGIVSESYNLGIFAGALLDRLVEDWKERIMRDPRLTPLEILSDHFKDETLPEPKKLTQEEIESVIGDIQEKIRFLVERQVLGLTALKQGFDYMADEDRAIMEMYLEFMLQGFEEMIKLLPEDEQRAQDDFIKAMRE